MGSWIEQHGDGVVIPPITRPAPVTRWMSLGNMLRADTTAITADTTMISADATRAGPPTVWIEED
jgi:hypothetical protein